MTDEQTMSWEQTLFNSILHAGNARSKALAAAEEAETGNYEEAEASLAEAETEQAEAHKIHAKVIQMEAGGEQVPFSVLLIHSMDLLLLSWAEIDHTRQMTSLFKRITDLESEVKKWRK